MIQNKRITTTTTIIITIIVNISYYPTAVVNKFINERGRV